MNNERELSKYLQYVAILLIVALVFSVILSGVLVILLMGSRDRIERLERETFELHEKHNRADKRTLEEVQRNNMK